MIPRRTWDKMYERLSDDSKNYPFRLARENSVHSATGNVPGDISKSDGSDGHNAGGR